jgi:hypothetical protein
MAFERRQGDPSATTTMKCTYATVQRAEQVRDLIAAGGRLGRADVDLAITAAGAQVYELAEVALRTVVLRTGRNVSFEELRAELATLVGDFVDKVRADAGWPLDAEP